MEISTNMGSALRGVALRTAVLFVAGLLLASLAGAPAVLANSGETADELIVEPSPDGSVDMTLVLTYDLSDDDDADGFNSIANDESVQEELRDRFEDRMQTVAADTDDRVDRDVSVSDAEIDLETDEAADIGTVTLSIAWEQLAVVEDGALVLTEPFASGFQTDQRMTVIAPDGYQFNSVNPDPTDSEDGEIRWGAGADLDGFEVVMHAVDTEAEDIDADDREDDETLPGFGLFVGLVSLLAAAGLFQFLRR